MPADFPHTLDAPAGSRLLGAGVPGFGLAPVGGVSGKLGSQRKEIYFPSW